ncbi:hypothetical protein [Haloarchaeobius sp. TZWWS8]|uniref:hypothetical protein n=1 Tax=Haloarchaeobius sp. TZWWS8 TaxID=3446121 RepID=UPI003EBA1558
MTADEVDTHYQTWRIEYVASDEQEARRILQSGRAAFEAETGRHSTTGIHVVVEIDGVREVITDLEGFASSTGIRGVLQKYGKEFDRVRDELAEYYGGTDSDHEPR